MCVAVPGKIIKIKGNTARVDVNHNECDVNIQLVDAKVGDYVLIHAGCVLEVMEKEMAEELIGLFQELEEIEHDDAVAGN